MIREMANEVKDRPVYAAILQADARDEAERFRQMVSERFDCKELYITEFTPVMGAHAGPGILGLVFYIEEDDPG